MKLFSLRDGGTLNLCLLLPFVQLDPLDKLEAHESLSEKFSAGEMSESSKLSSFIFFSYSE
jgi:hypothetical protein